MAIILISTSQERAMSTICPLSMGLASNSELSKHCRSCIKRHNTLFSALSAESLECVNAARQTLRFEKGDTVFKQGNKPLGLYILSDGRVKNVCVNDSGSEQIFSLNKAVEFIGFEDFLTNTAHSWSAVALSPLTICFIARDAIEKVLKADPAFSTRVSRHIAEMHLQSVRREANLRSKHMMGRMAETLLYLHECFGLNGRVQSIDLALKRSDFAALANMNTSNAIRVLSALARDGCISLDGSELTFHDTNRLRYISLHH